MINRESFCLSCNSTQNSRVDLDLDLAPRLLSDRNFVMVVVTLLFMFYLSWRLSLVAFISVPAIVAISKLYGNYIRKLSKLSQVLIINFTHAFVLCPTIYPKICA